MRRRTAPGTGRGSRPGCPPAGSCIAASTSASVEQPVDPAHRDQPVVEALLRPDVGVLQVDQLQPGVVPVEPVALAVVLEQRQLGHPVQLAAHSIGSRSQPVEHRLPAVEHVGGLGVGVVAVAVLDVLAGLLEVLHLQLDGGQPAAVVERDAGA